jgi:signal transduction histidine kinase
VASENSLLLKYQPQYLLSTHGNIDTEEEIINIPPLFLQLLRNYPNGSISIIDSDFNFVYTGGQLYNQLKTDTASLIGKKIFPIFPTALQEKLQSELSKVIHGNIISDFELRDCCFAGESYAMDAFPLLEEDSTIKRIGIIIRNISRLKKTEQKLKKALRKERELGELKSRFVSMASHEFRTPLSTILSSTYLLAKYTTTEDQSKREKHLDRIISSVNMLTDILNDFLSLGRIEEGKIALRPVSSNIKEIVNGLINEIKPLLKNDQTINYSYSGDETVMLDTGLLKHIILNLLSNAIKFSPENSMIELKTANDDEKFFLCVKDQGIGISKEDQKHLFERFFRGTNVTHIQGTGLGLHIVSRYAELMNGKVQCKSELEKGTEFIVTFEKKAGTNES